MPHPTPALELQALTKRYDDGLLALDAVDLVVPAYDADSLADVYVKAMAGVDVRSPT